MSQRYVIVGNGIAGMTAAQHLRRLDPDGMITMVTEEATPCYSRPGLMYHLMGTLKAWDLQLLHERDYADLGIRLRYDRVQSIDSKVQVAVLASGQTLAYDRLLLATGSSSRSLRVPGSSWEQIHTMYGLSDGQRVVQSSRRGMTAVIIGGGLLGVELAEVWRHFGVRIIFLVSQSWYFPRGLNEPQGRIVEDAIRRHGCELHLQQEISEIRPHGDSADIMTNRGDVFSANALGVTIGVDPSIELAKMSGLATKRGILVDAMLQTSKPHIFAAGDCAEIVGGDGEQTTIEQLWYSAMRQGAFAAKAMCGDPTSYAPGLFYNSAMFFDIDYVYIGAVRAEGDGLAERTILSRNGRAVRRFIHRNGIVTGISSVGAHDRAEPLLEIVRMGMPLETAIAQLGGRGW